MFFHYSCILLGLVLSLGAVAQTGTIKVAKSHKIDTTYIILGNPEFFKKKKVKYKGDPSGKTIRYIDYFYRKKVPSGYYMVIYSETRFKHSQGQILDGAMDGRWMFYQHNGNLHSVREYDQGKLIGRPRTVTNAQ